MNPIDGSSAGAQMSDEELKARAELLKKRIARITRERNNAMARFARLARVSEPFADQTAESLRELLTNERPHNIKAWSKAIIVAIEDEESYDVVNRAIRAAEAMVTHALSENPKDIRANRLNRLLESIRSA